MIADVVVAPIAEEQLTEVLPVIHRARLGNNARILRAARADVTAQLRRAGIPTSHAPARVMESDCLLVVNAAARSSLAASIALRHGAHSAWIVRPNGAWQAVDEGVVREAPPARSPAPAAAPATRSETLAGDPVPDQPERA